MYNLVVVIVVVEIDFNSIQYWVFSLIDVSVTTIGNDILLMRVYYLHMDLQNVTYKLSYFT